MKFTYDVSDVDGKKSVSGGGVQAPVGMYTAKVTDCKVAKPEGKDERLEIVYSITSKSGFAPLYDYISLESESVKWKLDQFLQAMGAATATGKRKGSADTDKFKGTSVKLQVRGDSYNGEYRARPGGVWMIQDGDEVDGDTDEDLEDLGDEGETDLATLGTLADADDDDAIDTLTQYAEQNGLDPDDYDTWAELAEALVGADTDSGDEEVPEDEEATEDEVDEEWTQFLGMDEDDLAENEDTIRTYADEVGVDVDTYDTWAEAIEAINDARNGDAEAEDEAGGIDYSSLSIAELKAALEERELPTGGSKAALIKRLEEDDASGTGPFDE